jgi:hypothetical protein
MFRILRTALVLAALTASGCGPSPLEREMKVLDFEENRHFTLRMELQEFVIVREKITPLLKSLERSDPITHPETGRKAREELRELDRRERELTEAVGKHAAIVNAARERVDAIQSGCGPLPLDRAIQAAKFQQSRLDSKRGDYERLVAEHKKAFAWYDIMERSSRAVDRQRAREGRQECKRQEDGAAAAIEEQAAVVKAARERVETLRSGGAKKSP